MAFPIILFNNSTGSDTAASGAGPATAISGTAAAHTDGDADTTITLTDSPDLSAVATDGSAALWLATASGRAWSRITGVDDTAKTVTVEDSFTIASGAALDYAIGGKRNGLNDARYRQFGDDAKAGWTIEFEYTGTDYYWLNDHWTIAASGDLATDGRITMRGTGASRPTLYFDRQTNVNSSAISLSGHTWQIDNLEMIRYRPNTSAASGTVLVITGVGSFVVTRCRFAQAGDAVRLTLTKGLRLGTNSTTYKLTCIDCEFADCDVGLESWRSVMFLHIARCRFTNNLTGSTIFGHNTTYVDCLVVGNDVGIVDGVSFDNGFNVTGCVFYDNEVAIQLPNSASVGLGGAIHSNLFVANGIGVEYLPADPSLVHCDYNAGYGNTTGMYSGLDGGDNDIQLTADPFEDAAGGNFNLNDTAGGGAVLRDVEVTL